MIGERIAGKRILVTGGTGSFGNKVARFLEGCHPGEITIFSRDEKKQYEMRQERPDYRYLLGDVRDFERINAAMRGIDIVFHAAALKQVPACEDQPIEAVKTNVVGSQNVAEAAIRNGVRVVVALSTDKAVKPINAMGISKAMMERIICSQNAGPVETRFCCVRYGNVMGSRGSVIPLFLKQIGAGGELTITNPEMRRFLMTLGQSVELVLHAIQSTKGGEVYVKKSPAVRVIDLAKAMLSKYGDGEFGRLRVTGVRPGEKLDEVLVNEYEMTRAVESEDYFEIPPEYRPGVPKSLANFGYEYTSANTRQVVDRGEIIRLLEEMGDTESYA